MKIQSALAVAALTLACTSAWSATAFWTGKQVQVQTVTYQMAWNCEYNYAGKTFWMTFANSCPSSVEVQ